MCSSPPSPRPKDTKDLGKSNINCMSAQLPKSAQQHGSACFKVSSSHKQTRLVVVVLAAALLSYTASNEPQVNKVFA